MQTTLSRRREARRVDVWALWLTRLQTHSHHDPRGTPLSDQQLIEHMDTLRERLDSWLQGLPPGERLEMLATVHDSLRQMQQMVKTVRRDTLVQLVDQRGIDRVSAALGVSEEHVLRLIAQRVS